VQQEYSATDSSEVHTPWLIEQEFERTGAYHMERDEALARERIEAPHLPNVLRLYSWQPAAVSIGFQQKMESIDLEACKLAGVDVVRRPTGGRAVLHINELTYAVIMRANPAEGIYAAHNRIVQALVNAVKHLGETDSPLEVTPASTGRSFSATYAPGTLTNVACFASSARHEVTWKGRKVIGSAQRRFGEILLQHGSILLTDDHLLLPNLLALPVQKREEMHAMLKRETASFSDIFGRKIGIEEAANAIAANFQMQLPSSIKATAAISLVD